MKDTWKQPGDHPGSWYEIRVEFDALLTDTQVMQAAGCIGYALRQTLHGESLSEPGKVTRKGGKGESTNLRKGCTIVRFGYDSTKAQSDDPDDQLAFDTAGQYVREGSPIRTTNRAGAGTAGTRLCEGLGNVSARFWVR